MTIKKSLAILMTMLMLVSLAACGSNNDSQNEENDKETKTETTASGGEETEEESEEVYTVAIQVVTLPGSEFAGQEDREAAINEIIEPAINCRVDIQEVWISELNQKTSMAAAGGEKLDILHVGTVSRLSSMVGSEILLDMNENNMLQDYGKELIDLFGSELLQAGNVNGQQLAIPAKVFNANAKGLYYNKTIADAFGIQVPDKISSLDELTNVLEEVKNKVTDVMPFFSGGGELNYLGWLSGYSGFGNKSSYGAILDESKDLTVVNLYATDLYKEFALTMNDWRLKGLQPGDPTDSSSGQDYFQAGKLFCVVSSISETIKANVGAENPDVEIGWIEMVEPKITNSTVTEYMWGIATYSERPDKAIQFLNMLYTNADVANILQFGIQEENYFMVGDNIAQINGTYLPIFFEGGYKRNAH